jgi:hypothetical protein
MFDELRQPNHGSLEMLKERITLASAESLFLYTGKAGKIL